MNKYLVKNDTINDGHHWTTCLSLQGKRTYLGVIPELSKIYSPCSQQLWLVEVDPEEHRGAQGDDENCPAQLEQRIA